MKVLIVGGTGFLGYHAALECLRHGYTVTAVARNKPQQTLFPDTVSLQYADMGRITDHDLKQLLAGHDALVYATSMDTSDPIPKPAYDYFYREHVQVCTRVVTIAREVGVTRGVILGSYFNTLDRQRPELRLTERHAYIRSRHVQAQEALQAAAPDMQLMILELPYIFGSMPGRVSQWAGLVNYVRSPYPLFFPSGGTAAISATHVAEAIVGALQYGVGGTRYPIGDENLTWVELLGTLSRLAGRPKRVMTLPTPLVRSALGLYQLILQLRGLEIGLAPFAYADIQTSNTFIDPEPARTALKFGQGGLEQALVETIQASPKA